MRILVVEDNEREADLICEVLRDDHYAVDHAGDGATADELMAFNDYDLVVLGAAREPYLQQVMFGEIPEKVARYSPASVLVVKRYEGHVRSWIKRALG